jgi:hypothetical protein
MELATFGIRNEDVTKTPKGLNLNSSGRNPEIKDEK